MPVRMILRLSKEEPVRFVSHLDMQTMLQRALRRAGLPVAYTHGFHPHAQISFALALGVGFTSAGEYVDIQLVEDVSERECASKLAASLPAGFGVCAVRVVHNGAKLSTLMEASEYCITAKTNAQALARGMQALLEKDEIMVRKQGKGGVKTVDIRPMIIGAKQEENNVRAWLWASAMGALSPGLLMTAVWEAADMPPDTPYRARRLDLVTAAGQSLLERIV